jgi:glycine betaine/proline transport system permease protein
LVDRDVLEAADAFGSSNWQKLKNVQLPLAMPTIMARLSGRSFACLGAPL